MAFGGRIYGSGEPEYLNSPESPLFRKRGVLFGLDAARDAIRSDGFAVLVEGYFDQISLRVRGLENVVAPLGTSLATEQVKLIKRFTSEVIVVFDGDDAGLRALTRSMPLFLSEGMEPRCVVLKEDKDPDEAVNKHGIVEFRRMLDSAVPMTRFHPGQSEKLVTIWVEFRAGTWLWKNAFRSCERLPIPKKGIILLRGFLRT